MVSGIGKPENFEKVIGEYKIIKHFKYRDHKNYQKEDVKQILEYKNYPILTTQKDAVKLIKFSLAKIEKEIKTITQLLINYVKIEKI